MKTEAVIVRQDRSIFAGLLDMDKINDFALVLRSACCVHKINNLEDPPEITACRYHGTIVVRGRCFVLPYGHPLPLRDMNHRLEDEY